MKNDRLKWEVNQKKKILSTPVFDVYEQEETSATGLKGNYIAIDAPDWVMTIPVYQDKFVLVRQWRHAAQKLSVEFPGGIADEREDPAQTASRELLEETGFKAGKITRLGVVSPNPALFSNRFHIYLAEELVPTGETDPDDDEFLSCELRPIDEVIASFGEDMYSHALMGTALALYLRHKQSIN